MYYYGATPSETNSMTLYEMASFIKAKKKKALDDTKTAANIAYSAGIVASMSMSKRRPTFKEVFPFPDTDGRKLTDVEINKKQMLVWAEEVNRMARRRKRDKR